MVGTLNVDWSTYTLQTYSDSTQIVEFSMPGDSLLYVVGAQGQGDTVWCRNKTEAVFILKNDSLEMSFFMKVIENLSPTNSVSVIDQLHYLQIPAQFNGQVLYFTLDKQLINGYGWQNGQIVSAISPNALPVQPGQQTDHLKGQKNNELYYTCTSEQVIYVNVAVYADLGPPYAIINEDATTGYVQVCGYADDGSGGSSGGTAPSGGVTGGGGGVGGSTATPTKCPTTTVSSLHGKSLASVAGCPVVTPPPVTPPPVIITTALTQDFPCATKLIVNKLDAIPQYVNWSSPFNTTLKPNLTWNDQTLPWNAPIPGSTSTSYQLGKQVIQEEVLQ